MHFVVISFTRSYYTHMLLERPGKFYVLGANSASLSMGVFSKKATSAKNEDSLSTGRKALIGAAGALPLLGLIGQEKLLHDPGSATAGKRYKTMADLARDAQPGDVLITTTPPSKDSIYKRFSQPVTGSVYYHAQPVVGRRKGKGVTISAGEYVSKDYAKASKRTLLRDSHTVDQMAKHHKYTDIALLRPKNISDAQRKLLAEANLKRAPKRYDNIRAVESYLREIFIPKLRKVKPSNAVSCEGNVCSTMPAQAAEEILHTPVVSKKPAKYTLPTDYLRSNQYELVGARTPSRYGKPAKLKTLLPRLGLGAALAGATYATTEKPELAAVPAGAVAGAALGGALKSKQITPAPTINSLLETFLAEMKPEAVKKIRKDFLTKRMLPAAAGGTLAYLGARKLMEQLNGQNA